jgi:hypothetical protein
VLASTPNTKKIHIPNHLTNGVAENSGRGRGTLTPPGPRRESGGKKSQLRAEEGCPARNVIRMSRKKDFPTCLVNISDAFAFEGHETRVPRSRSIQS